ncbi:CxC2 domain-containing protein [Mycena indigotica]|uniref:CxC2 domain-containing protein n=1 Tax=Mycena indigotica TaxID=2126181 RepID=A0A8H6SRK1_9AGAR|nr:CxC2 domain-containing protein [Mycena indigotica]KAF7304206.1 CxC2 domain-containing protein [Mycena indigotica]
MTDEQEMSTCSGLAALDHANSKFSCGYSVTGVGMGVCARHEFVLPNGVGDLQAGERYSNMDYIFASFMRHIDTALRKIISYDIVCQWIKKLLERLAKLPSLVRLQLALGLVRFAIPKMHIKGHLILCQILFSLMLILGSGMTDGEGIERPWSMIGGLSGSTRVSALLRRRLDKAHAELAVQEEAFQQLTIGHADRVPDWKKQVDDFETDNTNSNPYESKSTGLSEAAVRKLYEEEEAIREKAGVLPIHDVSPTEFVIAMLDVEADQRRVRALADLRKSRRSAEGVSLKQQRRKLNRSIKRIRTLQATYMPAALQRLDSLKISQETLAERVPLLPPSALSTLEHQNGGCKDGLVEIERGLRDAQCRSALTALQLQLHVKSRLLTYKKNNSRAQTMNTRSRTLVDQNERKVLLCSEKYQTAWKALTLIAGGADKISWRKLEKADIRCMEEPEDVLRREGIRRREEQAARNRDLGLQQAGLPPLPRPTEEMDNSEDEDGEDQRAEDLSSAHPDRQMAAREANALFKHGESRRNMSWIWTNAGDSAEAVEEGL